MTTTDRGRKTFAALGSIKANEEEHRMKNPKRNPKRAFSVMRGNLGQVAPPAPQSPPKVDANMAARDEAVSSVTEPAAAVDGAYDAE
jgi:hypothetical protein